MGKQSNSLGVALPNNIPIVSNAVSQIPESEQHRIDERYTREKSYIEREEKRMTKAWNKPTSNLRIVGEFLMANMMKEDLSYELITEKTGVEDAYSYVRQLNAWTQFPLRFQPNPQKKGHIQLVTKDEMDYELYNQRMERTIAKKEVVRRNAEVSAWSKFKNKPHQVIIEKKTKRKCHSN